MGLTAKQFNDWRVIPRILIITAYAFAGTAWIMVFNWFVTVDWTDIPDIVVLAVAGFPTVILSVLTTNVSTLTNNYFRTGSLNGGDR